MQFADERKQHSWNPIGEHSSVGKQVVSDVPIEGLPAKNVMAEAIHENLNSSSPRELPEALSVQRLAEYLEALVYIRVLQVRHQHVKDFEDLHYKQIRFPSFMWQPIRAIGDVIDPDDALELKVQVGEGLKRFSDRKYDWKAIVETMRALIAFGVKNGLELTTAMPKGKDGSAAILAIFVVNGSLEGPKPGVPTAEGMIRAAIDFNFTRQIWGEPRWTYNSVSWYHSQVYQTVHSSFKGVL